MGKLLLERFLTPEQLAQAAADKWLERIARGDSSRQLVAVSGGRISRLFFAAAADRVKKRSLSLDQIHFFWADERCVPQNHDDSNFLLAYDQLLRPAGVPDENIHRIRGEDPPQQAAQAASQDLAALAPKNAAGVPILDLILLGMGEDGHIASLFRPPAPNTETGVYVAVNDSPKPPPDRITLTYPVIEAAKEAWALVSGAGKEQALKDSLEGKTPLGRVIQSRRKTKIFSTITV